MITSRLSDYCVHGLQDMTFSFTHAVLMHLSPRLLSTVAGRGWGGGEVSFNQLISAQHGFLGRACYVVAKIDDWMLVSSNIEKSLMLFSSYISGFHLSGEVNPGRATQSQAYTSTEPEIKYKVSVSFDRWGSFFFFRETFITPMAAQVFDFNACKV